MKKALIIIAVIVLVLALLFVGCNAALFGLAYYVTNTESFDVNGTTVNIRNGEAYVVSFSWDGDESNTDIYFPVTVTNDRNKTYTITGIGGIAGAGNPVQCEAVCTDPNSSLVYIREGEFDPSSYDVPTELKELVFHVHLGADITEIQGLSSHRCILIPHEDGSQTIYSVRYHIECDPANRTFYSKDGRLYSREDDKVEDRIDYPSAPDETEETMSETEETSDEE